MNTIRSRFAIAAIGAAAALSACAAPSAPTGAVEVRQATIEQITNTQIVSSHHTGIGAVVGGVSGLGIGSLVGRGGGRDVARVLGVLGGAVAGNEVQKNYDRPIPAQHLIVRTDSGVLLSVIQPVDARLHEKQRVYLEGNGEAARVIPR